MRARTFDTTDTTGLRARRRMNRWRAHRLWAVLVMALTGSVLAAAASSPAQAQQAPVGEDVRQIEAELVYTYSPFDDDRCIVASWVVADDIPDAAAYEFTLVRTFPTAATNVVDFNEFSHQHIWEGTFADFPAPAGSVHMFWQHVNIFDPTCGPGSEDGSQIWHVESATVTTFTMAPVVPGEAAFEAISIPTGDGPQRCDTYVWITVPDVPTATRYDIEYLQSTFDEPVVRTLSLQPDGFQPSPPTNTNGVGAYATPGRLGHYIGTFVESAGGCTALEWRTFAVVPSHFFSPSFQVTTQDCFGRQPTIIATPGVPTVGTDGNDVILGTDGPDDIRGLGGNDRICSFGGADRVLGGGGQDRIDLGRGADVGRGGGGADRILGRAGQDDIRGNSGADDLRGGTGPDTIRGQGGADVIDGGRGTDRCSGGGGVDTLRRCE